MLTIIIAVSIIVENTNYNKMIIPKHNNYNNNNDDDSDDDENNNNNNEVNHTESVASLKFV